MIDEIEGIAIVDCFAGCRRVAAVLKSSIVISANRSIATATMFNRMTQSLNPRIVNKSSIVDPQSSMDADRTPR